MVTVVDDVVNCYADRVVVVMVTAVDVLMVAMVTTSVIVMVTQQWMVLSVAMVIVFCCYGDSSGWHCWLLWWYCCGSYGESSGSVVVMVTPQWIVLLAAIVIMSVVVMVTVLDVVSCYADRVVVAMVTTSEIMVRQQWMVLSVAMVIVLVAIEIMSVDTAVDSVVVYYGDHICACYSDTVEDGVIGCYGDSVMLLRWYSNGWWWCCQQWILSVVFSPACVCVWGGGCVCVWACVVPRAAWWSH